MTKLIATALIVFFATSASAKVIIVQDNGETETIQNWEKRP